jgi:hypothetical protein
MPHSALIFLQQSIVVVVAIAIAANEHFRHHATLQSRLDSVHNN